MQCFSLPPPLFSRRSPSMDAAAIRATSTTGRQPARACSAPSSRSATAWSTPGMYARRDVAHRRRRAALFRRQIHDQRDERRNARQPRARQDLGRGPGGFARHRRHPGRGRLQRPIRQMPGRGRASARIELHCLWPRWRANHRPGRHRPQHGRHRRADRAGGDADRQSPGPIHVVQEQRPDPDLCRQQRRAAADRGLRHDGGTGSSAGGRRQPDRRSSERAAARGTAKRRSGREGGSPRPVERRQDTDPGQGRSLRCRDEAQRHRRYAFRNVAANRRARRPHRPVAGLQRRARQRPVRPARSRHRHVLVVQDRFRQSGDLRLRQQHGACLRRRQDQRHHRDAGDRRVIAVLQRDARSAIQRVARRRRRDDLVLRRLSSTRPPAGTRSSTTSSPRS